MQAAVSAAEAVELSADDETTAVELSAVEVVASAVELAVESADPTAATGTKGDDDDDDAAESDVALFSELAFPPLARWMRSNLPVGS